MFPRMVRSFVHCTRCVSCGLAIQLVVLPAENGSEVHAWRHIFSGFYGCQLPVERFTGDNVAEPDWDELF